MLSSSNLNSTNPNFTVSDTFVGHQNHSRYAAFINLLTAEAALHSLAASFALHSFPGFEPSPVTTLQSSLYQPNLQSRSAEYRHILSHQPLQKSIAL